MEDISELDAFLHPQLIPSRVRLILTQRARQEGDEDLYRINPLGYWEEHRAAEILKIQNDFTLLKQIELITDLEEGDSLRQQISLTFSEDLFNALKEDISKEKFFQLAEDRDPVLGKMTDDQKEIFFPEKETVN